MSRDVLSRPLVVGLILLAVFVLFDIGLFSWLIFRSLSRSVVDDLVVETRQEAEEIAGQIAASAERFDQDLLMAVATDAETRTYIDDDLARRQTILMVQIVDHEERVVYRSAQITREGMAAEPLGRSEELEIMPEILTEDVLQETPYEVVEVPVGEIGNIQIGLRRAEVQRRLEVLRTDLIRQAGLILGVTLLLLVGAYLVIWRLWRRARRLEDEVRDSERLAYIGTLASGLAHEIRSPLNSLSLNMQMLEEDLGSSQSPASDNRLLSITQSEISRLERLVSDFLSYAKPRPPQMETVAAAELLHRVEAVLGERLRREEIQFEVSDRTEGAAIEADPEQLHQLLLNLIDNAIAAIRHSGRAPEIQLEAVLTDHKVALAVEDNGVGMTSDEQQHASDVFFSNRKGGTGLGLAIAARIAKNHGTRLEIETQPGRGTRVEVELLEAQAPSEKTERAPWAAPLGLATSRRDS